jgi:hypothetical protein
MVLIVLKRGLFKITYLHPIILYKTMLLFINLFKVYVGGLSKCSRTNETFKRFIKNKIMFCTVL